MFTLEWMTLKANKWKDSALRRSTIIKPVSRDVFKKLRTVFHVSLSRLNFTGTRKAIFCIIFVF